MLRFKAYAGRPALPSWGEAFRIRGVLSCRFAEQFLQDWFAAAELGNDGVELLAVVRNTAVGNVVAIPIGG